MRFRIRHFVFSVMSIVCTQPDNACAEATVENITLQLNPTVCALSINDKQCNTTVRAQWHATQDQSLCLIILKRPDIKQCWEHYNEGTYSVDMTFDRDLVFQLKDMELKNTLASATLRVIREALQYRHRRRDPWSLFG